MQDIWTDQNDMDNMDEVSYPVRIEQNQKVMYAYSEWETINQDGDTREKSATPQSFDIIIRQCYDTLKHQISVRQADS